MSGHLESAVRNECMAALEHIRLPVNSAQLLTADFDAGVQSFPGAQRFASQHGLHLPGFQGPLAESFAAVARALEKEVSSSRRRRWLELEWGGLLHASSDLGGDSGSTDAPAEFEVAARVFAQLHNALNSSNPGLAVGEVAFAVKDSQRGPVNSFDDIGNTTREGASRRPPQQTVLMGKPTAPVASVRVSVGDVEVQEALALARCLTFPAYRFPGADEAKFFDTAVGAHPCSELPRRLHEFQLRFWKADDDGDDDDENDAAEFMAPSARASRVVLSSQQAHPRDALVLALDHAANPASTLRPPLSALLADVRDAFACRAPCHLMFPEPELGPSPSNEHQHHNHEHPWHQRLNSSGFVVGFSRLVEGAASPQDCSEQCEADPFCLSWRFTEDGCFLRRDRCQQTSSMAWPSRVARDCLCWHACAAAAPSPVPSTLVSFEAARDKVTSIGSLADLAVAITGAAKESFFSVNAKSEKAISAGNAVTGHWLRLAALLSERVLEEERSCSAMEATGFGVVEEGGGVGGSGCSRDVERLEVMAAEAISWTSATGVDAPSLGSASALRLAAAQPYQQHLHHIRSLETSGNAKEKAVKTAAVGAAVSPTTTMENVKDVDHRENSTFPTLLETLYRRVPRRHRPNSLVIHRTNGALNGFKEQHDLDALVSSLESVAWHSSVREEGGGRGDGDRNKRADGNTGKVRNSGGDDAWRSTTCLMKLEHDAQMLEHLALHKAGDVLHWWVAANRRLPSDGEKVKNSSSFSSFGSRRTADIVADVTRRRLLVAAAGSAATDVAATPHDIHPHEKSVQSLLRSASVELRRLASKVRSLAPQFSETGPFELSAPLVRALLALNTEREEDPDDNNNKSEILNTTAMTALHDVCSRQPCSFAELVLSAGSALFTPPISEPWMAQRSFNNRRSSGGSEVALHALNPPLWRAPGNLAEAATARWAQGERVLVLDDVFSAPALAELSAWSKESAFAYSDCYAGNYLGAYLYGAITSPLVLRIAVELRATLPEILGGHFLKACNPTFNIPV